MADSFDVLVDITAITGDAILATLGRFPQEDRHCAFLAAETLQEALHAYMLTQRDKH